MTTLFIMNIKNLLMLAVLTIIAVSCAKIFSKGAKQQSNAIAAYANVGVDEFQTLIADGSVQLLDVRTPDEFNDGHIAGAVLVDVNENGFLEKAMAVLNAERPVAVYCRSGRRSARAASLLANQGYRVTNLDGGVLAWQDHGKELVK